MEPRFFEDVQLSGHIVDSLILPKVLDLITAAGGSFKIKQITIGQARVDPSYALIEVSANSEQQLQGVLAQIYDHGATPTSQHDCQTVTADIDGAFPDGFYSTTNQRTEVRIARSWLPVSNQEMDCGIVLDRLTNDAHSAPKPRCIPMTDVRRGMEIVVGHAGVRVFPPERSIKHQGFEFMSSAVSIEKPKGVAIRQIAQELHRVRAEGGRTLLVGGPAIVHTGSGIHLCKLIREGFVNRLFAGNALATHDIEQALYGTSLGVHLNCGELVEAGHEHHLRAINCIRRLGGISAAVDKGVLRSGIMYECVKNKVDFLLAGSIRDDGPLPEVITDTLQAQRLMREKISGVHFCLMIATSLHSIAVGNLLPAWVQVVYVDINPSTVIKLGDRGSFQTVGLVTDVEPFLRALVQELDLLGAGMVGL